MSARDTYTLTVAQYAALQKAWRPLPVMAIGRWVPDRYARMDAAWIALGHELGFDPKTAEWVSHEARTFTAQSVKP